MKERLASSVFSLVWVRGSVQILSLLATLVVARLLDPRDYGLMALVGLWTIPLILVSKVGFDAVIIQVRDLEERELNASFWLTVGVGGLAYLAVYAVAPGIGWLFGSPRLPAILRVAALAIPLDALRVVPDSLLRRDLALDKVSRAEMASVLVTIPVMLVMAWAGAGVWTLVAGVLLAPLVQGAATFWYSRWCPGLRVEGSRLRTLLGYGLARLSANICWVAYQQADTFVLGKVSGDVALGFYVMALQIALLPVEKVSALAVQLAFPVMAELQSSRSAMRAAFLRGVRLIACATFLLCFGLPFLAKDAVGVLLSDKWLPSVAMLQVLSIYAAIRSVAVLLPPVLMAAYRMRFLVAYNATVLAVLPLAFWLGAVRSEGMGVALAWVTVYPVMVAWIARAVLGELGISWRALLEHLWPPLAATAGMIATMLAVQWATFSWGSDPAAGRLAVMALAGSLVYGAVLLGVDRPTRGELQEVAGWLFRRSRAVSTAR